MKYENWSVAAKCCQNISRLEAELSSMRNNPTVIIRNANEGSGMLYTIKTDPKAKDPHGESVKALIKAIIETLSAELASEYKKLESL